MVMPSMLTMMLGVAVGGFVVVGDGGGGGFEYAPISGHKTLCK